MHSIETPAICFTHLQYHTCEFVRSAELSLVLSAACFALITDHTCLFFMFTLSGAGQLTHVLQAVLQCQLEVLL